ncbi:MAG: TonB-dependent receptor [Pseudomonadota bacterium]
MKFALLTSSALLLGTLAAPVALAQDAPAAPETGDQRRLQAVTVTAQKREQTLQDVPVAVSVVDETTLEQAEILDIGALQSVVPSLRVGQLQSSANTNFIIRGFGNGANNAGIEPSVGVFIDGVYRSRSAAQIADLPNLQRVEVLRGPQSTLFGKNASAGVISIVTEAPQYEWGGGAELSLGNYQLFRIKGDVTGPIIDDVLAFSLAAGLNERDGYAEDLAAGGTTNQRDRNDVRAQLLFEPTPDLSFRVIGDYGEIDEICCVAANLVNGPTGAAVFALGGALDPEDPFSFQVFNNFPSTNEITNSGVSFHSDWTLPFATLSTIYADRRVDLLTDQDIDFTSADLAQRSENDAQIETRTYEARLTSNTDGAIDWMVGAFYFDETVRTRTNFEYGADFRAYVDALSGNGVTATEQGILGLPAGTFLAAGQGPAEFFGQDNEALSVFGTVDFHVTDRLTLTAGVNYTEDEKDAYGAQINTDAFSALDFVEIGNTVLFQTAFAQTLAGFGIDATDPAQLAGFAAADPAAFAQVQAGSQAFADMNDTNPDVNPLLGFQPLQFLPPFVDFPNSVESGQSSDDEVTWQLRAAYDLTDAVNIYASAVTGFKATSWNLSRDSRPFPEDLAALQAAGLTVPNLTLGSRFAGPEEATVYELGLKAAFNTWALNVAVFDQTIEGFQSNVFTGTGFALANAGEQSTLGLEFDATWSPVEPLTLVFAGTFLDPEYDSFVASATGDISGTQPSGISETALSVSGAYNFTLPTGLDGFVRADWQYESESDYFDAVAEGSPATDNQALLGFAREINTLNASVGFLTDTGTSITFWARNLNDDQYVTTAFPSVAQAGSLSGYPNQPRTYGVTVRQSF